MDHNTGLAIAKCAYRMGRKDALRYAKRSTGDAHVDSNTVDLVASLIWVAVRGDEADPFVELDFYQQARLQAVARMALTSVGRAMIRALEEAPPDPVSFDAIVLAATD